MDRITCQAAHGELEFDTGTVSRPSPYGDTPMHMLWFNVAICAVALLFCIYQTYCRLLRRKKQQYRESIAHLLWVLAERAGEREVVEAGR